MVGAKVKVTKKSERNARQDVEMTRSTDNETSIHVARKMSTPVNVDV